METQQKWKRKTDRFLDVWRCLRRNKAAMTGLIVILIFVLLAVFAGVICDYDMVIKQDTVNRFRLRAENTGWERTIWEEIFLHA